MAERMDTQTLAAVGALFELADEHGIGLNFPWDAHLRSIGYSYMMGGGHLATARTLKDAAGAALRPLADFIALPDSVKAEPGWRGEVPPHSL